MKKYFMIFAAALALAACSEKTPDEPAVQDIFEVDETAIEAEAAANDYFKAVTSNGNWTATVTVGADWITVDPTSSEGTTKRKKNITISVAENTAAEAREGAIKIAQGDKSATIAVKQAAGKGEEQGGDDTGTGDPVYPAYDSSKPMHVAWNNYAMTDNQGRPYANGVNQCLLRGAAWDYSWSSGARFVAPNGSDFNCINNKSLPTEANLENPLGAYLSVCDYGLQHVPAAGGTATSEGAMSGTAGLSYNPGYQIQKMLADDFIFFCIPVKNLKSGQKITVEGSMGSAASAAGVFVLEYSTNFNTSTYAGDWYVADGGIVYGPENANEATAFKGTSTLEGAAGNVFHFKVTTANYNQDGTAKTRYVYSKDPSVDNGYTKIQFSLSQISDIADGCLYLRLRSFFGMRANEGNSATGGGWTDLKFFEVTFE